MAGPTTVDWGDGQMTDPGPEKGTVSHKYAANGNYTIKVCDKADATKCTTLQVTIPYPTEGPTATATADPANGLIANLAFQDFPTTTTTVKINWGDGTAEQTGVAVTTGSGTGTHTYAAGTAGTAQNITVTSEQDATQTATTTFTPQSGGGGTPTVTAEPAADTMTAQLNWTDFTAANTTVSIDWGDGTAAQTAVPTTGGAGNTTHTYAAGTAGTAQTIVVTGEQDATKTATTTFTPQASGGGVQVTAAQGADVNSAQGTATGMDEALTYTYQFIAPAGGTNVPAAPAPLPAGGAVPSTTLTAGTGWVLRVTDNATPTPGQFDSDPFDIPWTPVEPVTVTAAQGADVNSAQGTVANMVEGTNYTYQFIAPAGGTNVPAAPAAVPAGGAVPSTTLTAGTGWVLRVVDDAAPTPNQVDSDPFDIPWGTPEPVTVAVAQGADVNSAQGTVTGMDEALTYTYQFIAPAGGTNVPAAPAAVPAGGAVPSTTLTAGTGWILRVIDSATPTPGQFDSDPFNVPFAAVRAARGRK